MTIDVWPSALPCGAPDFGLQGGSGSAGSNGVLPSAVGATYGGPHWVASINSLPIRNPAQLAAARALEGLFDGGATPVMVSVCVGNLSPKIANSPGMGCTITADALAGATTLHLSFTGSHVALRGGEMLNVDDDVVDKRLYMIMEVTGGTADAPIVRIKPALRAALTSGDAVYFDNLVCPMRLVDGFDLPVSLGRFSETSLNLEEWFDPPVVLALRHLTLSPHRIASGSPEDTFVGYLIGTTAGSTVTITDDAGSRFKLVDNGGGVWSIVAGSVATDYGSAHNHNITVRETLSGYLNSPRDSVLTVNVTNIGHRYWRVFLPLNNGSSPPFTSLASLIFATTVSGADITGSGTAMSGGLGVDEVPDPPSHAFDNNSTTVWARSSATDTWIGYDFGSGNAPDVAEARLQGSTNHLQSPSSAILQWSNGGSGDPSGWTWVTAATATYGDTWVVSGARSCPETNPAGQYRKVLMRNTASVAGGFETIAELEIRDGGGSDLTPNGGDTTAGRPVGYSNSLNPPGFAFDNDAGTYWFAPAPGAGDVGYVFPSPVDPAVLAVKPYSNANWAPGSFTVVGTNDDVTFDTLTSQSGLIAAAWTPGTFRTFSL